MKSQDLDYRTEDLSFKPERMFKEDPPSNVRTLTLLKKSRLQITRLTAKKNNTKEEFYTLRR